jgi:hypothetical protein
MKKNFFDTEKTTGRKLHMVSFHMMSDWIFTWKNSIKYWWYPEEKLSWNLLGLSPRLKALKFGTKTFSKNQTNAVSKPFGENTKCMKSKKFQVGGWGNDTVADGPVERFDNSVVIDSYRFLFKLSHKLIIHNIIMTKLQIRAFLYQLGCFAILFISAHFSGTH